MQKLLIFTTLLILALQLIGSYLFWYATYPWFDIPMHILGGFWIGLLTIYILEDKYNLMDFKINPYVTFLVILGSVATVGLLWEIFEFSAGTIPALISPLFERHIPNYLDSGYDLLNDVLGAIPAVLYGINRRK